MMATVILFNIDIQIHGGANTLLAVDGRTPRFTLNLLYSGAQTHLNRGNHYDPLTPKDTPLTIENMTSLSKWITVGKGEKTYISIHDLTPSESEECIPPPPPSKSKSRSTVSLHSIPRITEGVTVGKRNKTFISLSEPPSSVIFSEVPSPSHPPISKARTPPTSPSSTPPLSKHEKRQPWNRQLGNHGSPSPPSPEAPVGDGGKETGRKSLSPIARKKGMPPPKGHHRHPAYSHKTAPSDNTKKLRYRQKKRPSKEQGGELAS